MRCNSKYGVMFIFVVLVCGLLSGCSKNENAKDSRTHMAEQYVEESITLPTAWAFVMDMQQIDENTVRILTADGIYETNDYGVVWRSVDQKPSFFTEKLNKNVTTGESWSVHEAAIDKYGNMLYILHGCELEEYEEGTSFEEMFFYYYTEYIYVTVDGQERLLDIEGYYIDYDNVVYENYMEHIFLADNGDILGMPDNKTLYQIDAETGQTIRTYEPSAQDGTIQQYTSMENTLILLCSDGFELYDLESGKILEADPALEVYYELYMTSPDKSDLKFARSWETDRVYFFDKEGMYCYKPGQEQVAQIMDSKYHAIAGFDYSLNSILAADQEHILASGSSGGGEFGAFYYYYDEEAEIEALTELSIYTLTDNDYLRQLISDFQKYNAGYYINLEIGYTGMDAVTAEDAISVLNTKMLAGEGPDILILDGLPADSYAETGALLDLSEFAAGLCEAEELFENIFYINQRDDGLYSVPVNFDLPVISGEKGFVTELSSLRDLMEDPEKLLYPDDVIESVTGASDAESIADSLYLLLSSQLLTDDMAVVDEEIIHEILEYSELVYENSTQSEILYEVDILSRTNGFYYSGRSGMYAIADAAQTSIEVITAVDHYHELLTINEMVEWEYVPVSIGADVLALPRLTVGISAGTNAADAGMAFISYILSKEVQSEDMMRSGLPVNKGAFYLSYETEVYDRDVYSVRLSGGASSLDEAGNELYAIWYDRRLATEEEMERLREEIESVTAVPLYNNTVRAIVNEEAVRFLRSDQSIEETSDKIVQALKLYIAE